MKDIRDIFLAFVILIIAFLGAVFGIWIANLPTTGVFTPWTPLNSSVKFSQIADASISGVWAQSTDGELYFWALGDFCFFHPQAPCNQWVETKDIPTDAHAHDLMPTKKGETCPEGAPSKEPPARIVECAFIAQLAGGYISTYFALLKDGTIWVWIQPSHDDTLIIPIICAFIGFSLGGIAGIFLIKRLFPNVQIF